MVVFGLSSLRGAAKNFSLFSHVLKSGLPSWTVIQNWILRFGLYKLKQKLPRRDDWVLILDHTVEFGVKKCLVVLAVSLEDFRKKKCSLKHQDMHIAAISINKEATGIQISEVMKGLCEQMGAPAQIVSDAGSNIKRAIIIMQESYPEIIATYDITHKAALLLKSRLEHDKTWQAFCTKLAKTRRRVIQTEFVVYAPKTLRNKSRWLNMDEHLKWAEKILKLKTHKAKRGLSKAERKLWDEKFDDYYGWVGDYKGSIKTWSAMLDVLGISQKELKANGLSKNSARTVSKTLKKIKSRNKIIAKLKDDISIFLGEESSRLTDDKPWLATSDIIESIFGKYKIFSAKTPLKEIGKSVLTIPVLTSKVTPKEVREAMETISAKELKLWLSENLGESLFAKRMRLFSAPKEKTA